MNPNESIRASVFVLQTPLLAARDEGFFADEGLDVSFERTDSSTAQRDRLTGGHVDVIQTAADNLIGPVIAGTADVRIFHVADLGLDQMVVARQGIEFWEALRGGRVAVDSASSGYAFVLYRMLEEQGIAAQEYEAVAVGGPGPRFEHLCNGTVDVGLLNPHMAALARARGLTVLARCADSFPGYPNLVLGAAADAVRERGAALAAFGRAVDRGVRWAHDPGNAGRAIELIAADRSCGEDEARRAYESERALRAVADPTPVQVRDGLDMVVRLRERMGGGYLPVEGYYAPVTAASA